MGITLSHLSYIEKKKIYNRIHRTPHKDGRMILIAICLNTKQVALSTCKYYTIFPTKPKH